MVLIIVKKSKLLKTIFILIVFSSFCFGIPTYFGICFDHKNTIVIENKKTKRSNVATIKHKISGSYFCVKQLFSTTSSYVARTIYEVFASNVAKLVNIPVNKVLLILPKDDMPGKKDRHGLATLHTFIEGESILKKGPYSKIDLKQKQKDSLNKTSVPQGVTLKIIKSMSYHPDLPKIIAFDMFVGNADRSKDNLFYNKKTNCFVGIDLERSLTYNLCGLTRKRFEKIIQDKKSLSKKEIRALNIFQITLHSLIKNNPPEKSLQKINDLIANIKVYDYRLSEKKLNHIYTIIFKSYTDAKKLIILIDKLIQQNKYYA